MQIRWRYFLILLSLIAAVIWLAVVFYPGENLKIIACDVGQGDAILAVLGDTQILFDGGPNAKVIDCLSRYMPFWDRRVEVIVLSHPQKDHYMGLIEVMKKYEVQKFVATPLDSGTEEYRVLKNLVGSKGISVINPTAGMVIGSSLIHIDILYPSEEFLAGNFQLNSGDLVDQSFKQTSNILGSYTSSLDPNEFSIVLQLSYKNFDAFLTGDISPKISDLLAEEFISSVNKSVEYIKIPHHGSKNGLSKKLLDAVSPEVAVISVGKNNSYGHPHAEILKMLEEKGVQVLRTDLNKDVIVESDGESWEVVN